MADMDRKRSKLPLFFGSQLSAIFKSFTGDSALQRRFIRSVPIAEPEV